MANDCFIPFTTSISQELIPEKLNDPFDLSVPAICKIAAKEAQEIVAKNQINWIHNFGLEADKQGPERGKMFGILVVKNAKNELGFLCTFSGKLADNVTPPLFVPSLFDIGTNDNFITKGLQKSRGITRQILSVEKENKPTAQLEIERLKQERKALSNDLQNQLFDEYNFLNRAMELKSIWAIFSEYYNKKPPSAAGECAAPKLLQYAFQHNFEPLAIAEFWWGKSSNSDNRKHLEFYPACNDKCRPILDHMLG